MQSILSDRKMLPTAVRFDEQSNGFAFDAEILGRNLHCLINMEAVEYLFGKAAATPQDKIRGISETGSLVQIAADLTRQGAIEPLKLTLQVVKHYLY